VSRIRVPRSASHGFACCSSSIESLLTGDALQANYPPNGDPSILAIHPSIPARCWQWPRLFFPSGRIIKWCRSVRHTCPHLAASFKQHRSRSSTDAFLRRTVALAPFPSSPFLLPTEQNTRDLSWKEAPAPASTTTAADPRPTTPTRVRGSFSIHCRTRRPNDRRWLPSPPPPSCPARP